MDVMKLGSSLGWWMDGFDLKEVCVVRREVGLDEDWFICEWWEEREENGCRGEYENLSNKFGIDKYYLMASALYSIFVYLLLTALWLGQVSCFVSQFRWKWKRKKKKHRIMTSEENLFLALGNMDLM